MKADTGKNRILRIILPLIIISSVLAFMLYCNFHTSMLVDDYGYCFDFSTGWDSPNPDGLVPPPASGRIDDVFSIFASMASHRQCHSGRVLSHFLVQLFLMMPKWVFNIFNSLMFILQAVMIYLCGTVLTGKKSLTGAAAEERIAHIHNLCFRGCDGNTDRSSRREGSKRHQCRICFHRAQ